MWVRAMVAPLLEKSASPLPPTLKKYKSERIIREDVMADLRINHSYYTTPEFAEYAKRGRKRLIFEFLWKSIIRESEAVKDRRHGAHYIYKEHFLKGQLVSRYSQKNLGKCLGIDQSNVSKDIKDLAEEGLLQIIKKNAKVGTINYYQLGFWTGTQNTPSYKEILFFDTVFEHYVGLHKRRKREKEKEDRIQSLEAYKGMLNPDHFSYDEEIKSVQATIDKIREIPAHIPPRI